MNRSDGNHVNTLSIINPDDGRRYRLNIKGEIGRLTIGRLKQCLAAASSCLIPPADQVLKLNGVPLHHDEEVCAMYGITKGSTLTVEHRYNVDPTTNHMASFVSPQRRALEYQTIRQQEMSLSKDITACENNLQEKIDHLQDQLLSAEQKKMDLERERNRAERELQKVCEQGEIAEKEKQHLNELQQLEAQRAARRAADLAARREQLKAEEEMTRTVALQKLENERRKALLEQHLAEYEAEKTRLRMERESYDRRAKEREISIREKEIDIEHQVLAAERDRRELEMNRLISQKNRELYYNRVGVVPPLELQQVEGMVGWNDRVPLTLSPTFHGGKSVPRTLHTDAYTKYLKGNGCGGIIGLNVSGSEGPSKTSPSMPRQRPQQQQQAQDHQYERGEVHHPHCPKSSDCNIPPTSCINCSIQSEQSPSQIASGPAVVPMRPSATLVQEGGLYSAHENAIENLHFLSQELGLEETLKFDTNNTCVIGVDGQYTLLVTFDATTERLYLYSTILTAIPRDASMRLRVYEFLIEGSLLGREMCGGGVGASIKNDFILLSTSIYLPTSHSTTLCIITPNFIRCLDKWREKLQEFLDSLESQCGTDAAPVPTVSDNGRSALHSVSKKSAA